MTAITSFEQAMAVIHERSGYDRGFISNPFAGDDAARLGLVRTSRVLDRLGNPERDYPIVHVAGSKGKGSTCSFIDSILRSAGATCGRFLSPHLHSFQERFVVNDREVGKDDFTRLVNDVYQAALQVETNHPDVGELTAWELSTAMVLLWFSRCRCDVAVVEVGLGGTLDATNVVTPAASVITRLDYEHTAILGSSMAEIASNKAGIIKPGVPVASADQPPEGSAVIEARAGEFNSPLLVANRDWTVQGSDASFSARGPNWRYDQLRSSLIGRHQVDNAGLAIAALHLLAPAFPPGIFLTEQAIRSGLANTFIPGRFEIIRHHPGNTIVIDGAHSPESTRALADAIRAHFPDTRPVVIIGMLSDKDPGAVLPPLFAIAGGWIVAPVQSPRAIAVAEIASTLDSQLVTVVTAESVANALEVALQAGKSDLIVVTGSLTTAAEARVALGLA